MELLKKLLSTAIREQLNIFSTSQRKYIFYRIVDIDQSIQKCTLQCINSRTVFYASIADVIFDKSILYRLHPIQACYMGIEYAKGLNEGKWTSLPRNHSNVYDSSNTFCGTYFLRYQDRKNNICFVNGKTREESVIDPRDMVLSEALIEEFGAAQAFHIGLLAGIKMDDAARKGETCKLYHRTRRPYLWLVK